MNAPVLTRRGALRSSVITASGLAVGGLPTRVAPVAPLRFARADPVRVAS